MIDISKNELYVLSPKNVMQGYIPQKSIPLCHPRKNDGFVFILGGSCSYTFENGRTFTARKGDLLYLADGSTYSMEVHERYDYIVANFIFRCEEARKSDVFKLSDSFDAESIFTKLMRKYRQESPARFAEICSLIYQIYAAAISSRNTGYLPGSTKQKIAKAKERILHDPASADLTVTSLAQSAGMSEVYFRKLFRAHVGCSPAEFIINCRIARARELLELDYLSLADVAEQCGFSSASYFCRAYKKCTGLTPRQAKDGSIH